MSALFYCIENGLFRFYLWHQFYYSFHYGSNNTYISSPTPQDLENIIWDLRYKMEKGRIPTPDFAKISFYVNQYWDLSNVLINEIESMVSFSVSWSDFKTIKVYRKKLFFWCYLIALKCHLAGDFVE